MLYTVSSRNMPTKFIFVILILTSSVVLESRPAQSTSCERILNGGVITRKDGDVIIIESQHGDNGGVHYIEFTHVQTGKKWPLRSDLRQGHKDIINFDFPDPHSKNLADTLHGDFEMKFKGDLLICDLIGKADVMKILDGIMSQLNEAFAKISQIWSAVTMAILSAIPAVYIFYRQVREKVPAN